MWTLNRSLVFILIAISRKLTVATRSLQESGGGSYWAIYNETIASAEDLCLASPGESVDESCCLGAGETLPHAAVKQGDETCFELAPGLPAFSGCVGDALYGYGENCSGDGAPFVASNAGECGCGFVIEGSGCYKANDLPEQQWFVYLDSAACIGESEPDETPAPSPASPSAPPPAAIAWSSRWESPRSGACPR